MPMMMTSNSSTPGASSSRHSSPINGPLNTDGPIPPRLRGSPFLAAVSSSSSGSTSSSTSSSSSSLTTLATLSSQQSLSSSLTSPYSYGSTLNNSDSALPQSLASTAAAASTNAQWNDHTSTATRPTLIPHKLHQQQRIRTANTRAASVSGVASPSSMMALSTSSFSSSSSSSSTSTINRPGTPIPHIRTDVNTFTPTHSHSLSLPNRRAKSPLAGSSSSPSSPPKHISIPPPPTIVPESLLSLGSGGGELASTPYPHSHPHPNPFPYPSSSGVEVLMNASALDDSSDLSSDDDDDDDAEEEYFDSCSSAYISSPSTSASSSTSFSSHDSFNDADVSSCFVVPNQAKMMMRPRGQSTSTTTACLGREDNDNGGIQMQKQVMELGACLAAALTLGINNSVPSQ